MSQSPLTGPYNATEYLGTTPWFPQGIVTDPNTTGIKYLYDASTSPAAVGSLLVLGSADTWAQSSVTGASYAPNTFGIVTVAATGVGAQATLQTGGMVNATCTTQSVALAAGSPLISDGSGYLTTPSPSIAPSSATATAQVTGSSTVTYLAYARNAYTLDSVASSGITTTTAPATITSGNPIAVAGTVPAGTTSVIIVRSAGGASQGVIGQASVAPGQTKFNFLDWGQAAGAATYTPNATPSFVPGQLLGFSLGALAGSSAATSVSVLIAGR